MPPPAYGRRRSKMGSDVCLSVRLSVACLNITRERKSLWKPIFGNMEGHHTGNTWTCYRSKGQRSRSPGSHSKCTISIEWAMRCTSFKVNGQRLRSIGRLTLRPEVRHILWRERPTNIKLDTLVEYEDSYHRQVPLPTRFYLFYFI